MQADGIVHVIDDDEAMRDSLVFLLKSAKIPVKAYEGAVAFLSRMPTDSGCVITDVRMPEMSGIDLLKRLRQMKNPVPVIIITGHGDVPLAVEAMKCGAKTVRRRTAAHRRPHRLVEPGRRTPEPGIALKYRTAHRTIERPRAPGARRIGRRPSQ
jgi:two-component system response regulator FixJ